jgi:hypothetical protein
MGKKPSFDIIDVKNLAQFHILPETFIYLSPNFQAGFGITSLPYYLYIFISLLYTQHKTLLWVYCTMDQRHPGGPADHGDAGWFHQRYRGAQRLPTGRRLFTPPLVPCC